MVERFRVFSYRPVGFYFFLFFFLGLFVFLVRVEVGVDEALTILVREGSFVQGRLSFGICLRHDISFHSFIHLIVGERRPRLFLWERVETVGRKV